MGLGLGLATLSRPGGGGQACGGADGARHWWPESPGCTCRGVCPTRPGSDDGLRGHQARSREDRLLETRFPK